METFVNTIKGQALSVAEKFAPVLKESKFKETGILTPEEFVVAGDHLVYHCPTWQWSAGEQSKMKSYLPQDKQYLITRNVPCFRRVKQLENCGEHEKVIESDDFDAGWVDTHSGIAAETVTEICAPPKPSGTEDAAVKHDTADSDDEGPPIDMESFEESGLLDTHDPHVFVSTKSKHEGELSTADNVLSTRTYDLIITYDNYYKTPRMWISGYDEQRKPLTVAQMYEDFSQDHANKTITMETHPHLSQGMASIHPCRHAEVMKKLISTLAESGKELGVHQYLLVFLKFIQAVVPTIEYDFTMNVQL